MSSDKICQYATSDVDGVDKCLLRPEDYGGDPRYCYVDDRTQRCKMKPEFKKDPHRQRQPYGFKKGHQGPRGPRGRSRSKSRSPSPCPQWRDAPKACEDPNQGGQHGCRYIRNHKLFGDHCKRSRTWTPVNHQNLERLGYLKPRRKASPASSCKKRSWEKCTDPCRWQDAGKGFTAHCKLGLKGWPSLGDCAVDA